MGMVSGESGVVSRELGDISEWRISDGSEELEEGSQEPYPEQFNTRTAETATGVRWRRWSWTASSC